MRDAMDMVKAGLGPDAVIMSTRELPSGNVEITAATDPDPQSAVDAAQAGATEENLERSWFVPEPEMLNGLYAELKEMRQEISRLRAQRTVGTRSNHQWDRLMHELKDLGRVMGMRGVNAEDAGDALITRLVAGGVEVTLARALAQQVAAESNQQRRMQMAALRIQTAFEPAPAVWARDKHTVAAFVGPTGVGKTTTLAKVAANAVVNHGMSVALVAADTYRIGAVDQVRTYADLLNVPCVVAQGSSELKQALNRFRRKDLVLIDTAGGNPWSDQTLADTDALLHGTPVERHLCVAAGTPGNDLGSIVQRYSQSGIRSLVVTKMDEARNIGGVLSTVWGTDYQIAHITTGQQVPGDIETPDPAQLCQAVLG